MKRKQLYRKNVHTLVSLLLLFVSFVFGNSVEPASVNPVLKLYYKQPFGFDEETGEPKPILVYSLTGDGGVVDGHTGKWISFDQMWEERTEQ
ncbi:hypothetical protein [Brevibacillus centrosporus]|uniref:hypothetical protein n=1 Tax=Brevibacillus centrosporus TaxID=54910 RepID=UPI003B0214CC